MRPVRCPSVVTVLITPKACELPPNRRQGDPPAVGTDHPSQDRRSLADLVSSPPLATDHESRLHQLAGDAALKPQAAEGQRMDGGWRHCLKKLICLLMRIGRVARISVIPRG